MKNSWSFFDSIYCINLLSRDDRYNHAKNIFEKYNIPVKFHRVKKDSNTKRGCFTSHIEVINKAYNQNCKYCVIFEDDIRPNCIESIDKAINFIKNNNDQWDILYLGGHSNLWTFGSKSTHIIGENIYFLESLCTHAYVLNRKSMLLLKDLSYTNISIDVYFRKNLKTLSVYPSVFFQGGFSSDINSADFCGKDFSTWCFLPTYFRYSEMYAYYVGVPYYIVVLAILLIVLVSTGLLKNPIIIIGSVIILMVLYMISLI